MLNRIYWFDPAEQVDVYRRLERLPESDGELMIVTMLRPGSITSAHLHFMLTVPAGAAALPRTGTVEADLREVGCRVTEVRHLVPDEPFVGIGARPAHPAHGHSRPLDRWQFDRWPPPRFRLITRQLHSLFPNWPSRALPFLVLQSFQESFSATTQSTGAFSMATAKRTGAPKRPSTSKPAKSATAARSTRATKATKSSAAKKSGAARGTMTEAHKRALADGREAALHVRRYLDALEAHRPRRGRQRTPASVRKQLADVEAQWGEASGLKRVELAQKRIDLNAVLAGLDTKVDLSDLRAGFVKHAKRYSASKGITYTAWRDAGVSPDDLRAAGISRRNG